MSPARRNDVVSLSGKSGLSRLRFRYAVVVAACVALAVTGALPVLGSAKPATAATQASSATMSFNGALNLLGVLNSLTVSPSQVSVPAGGQVTFANRSGISMTLSVAGQSVSLPAGGSRTFGFPGKSSPQTFSATVTPLNVPVLGSATQSTGTVKVGAQQAAAPSSPGPSPSQGGSPSQNHSGDANPKAAQTPGGQNSNAAGQNQAKTSDGTKWQFGEAPVLLDGNANNAAAAQAPRSTKGAKANSAANSTDAEGLGGEGWVGLLIAVAAVFLVGVGSAAVRAVVVQRRTALGG